MEFIPEVPAAFRAEVTRRDPSAAGWLDRLPELWRDLSADWTVDAIGEVRTGSTSLVIPVATATGGRAAVKLVSPVASMDSEAAALTAFDGHGAVKLFEADRARGAMLLEWVDGPSLIEMIDTEAAMSIAGRLSRELAAATPPPGSPRLAEQAHGWLEQLRAQHERAQHTGTALSDHYFELASDIIDRLASDGTQSLTHGDLSLSNILQADRDRWVAIDPSLVVGTAANEAHTVVRSHLMAIVRADEPALVLRDWTRRFAGAAGEDYAWAQALSFARYLASYYWESQHDGGIAKVAALRDATVITATCI